jgi:hypothetical protein
MPLFISPSCFAPLERVERQKPSNKDGRALPVPTGKLPGFPGECPGQAGRFEQVFPEKKALLPDASYRIRASFPAPPLLFSPPILARPPVILRENTRIK